MFQLIEDSAVEIRNDDFYDKVATVAHNCYQVKEKDHESNVAFISRLISARHLAMVEHYTYTFKVEEELYEKTMKLHNRFYTLSGLQDGVGVYLVTLSLRVLLEALYSGSNAEKSVASVYVRSLPEDVKVLFDFDSFHLKETSTAERFDLDANRAMLPESVYQAHKTITYHIITDRGVTHEIVRHRLCAFAQESTRYCNYTKDKFSNCLTFMKPLRYDEFKDIYDAYYSACSDAYFKLVSQGARPDEARSVLPNSLKASIMVTCSIEEWKTIFSLRISDHAHPDINRVMIKVRDDMKKKGYIQ